MKFLFDFFPIILFWLSYKFPGVFCMPESFAACQDIKPFFVATGVAIVATFLQVGFFWARHRRFERMHVITLVLITTLGGATLYFQDPNFLIWKVSVINWIFGATFLGSQFIGSKSITERMMGATVTLPSTIWTRLNLSWVTFFLSIGFINLYVAENYDESTWVDFKLYGVLGLTFAFIVIQMIYLSRHITEDDINAHKES
ncbi:MAG: septation protein A [Proteobacteria bacterium]|nr:septation protein A [Pseudomonadota bacterium]